MRRAASPVIRDFANSDRRAPVRQFHGRQDLDRRGQRVGSGALERGEVMRGGGGFTGGEGVL